MTPLTLADFSAVERDVRASHYPRMVAARELTAEEAQHDWQCWVAIAEICASNDWSIAVPLPPAAASSCFSWDDLEKAANKALAARDAACAAKREKVTAGGSGVAALDSAQVKKPPTPLASLLALEARRDAVAAIAWRIGNKAKFYRDLNRQLQELRAA